MTMNKKQLKAICGQLNLIKDGVAKELSDRINDKLGAGYFYFDGKCRRVKIEARNLERLNKYLFSIKPKRIK